MLKKLTLRFVIVFLSKSTENISTQSYQSSKSSKPSYTRHDTSQPITLNTVHIHNTSCNFKMFIHTANNNKLESHNS